MNQNTQTLDFEITEQDLETAYARSIKSSLNNICYTCVVSTAAQRLFGDETISSSYASIQNGMDTWLGGSDLADYMDTFDRNYLKGLVVLKSLLKPQKFVLTLRER